MTFRHTAVNFIFCLTGLAFLAYPQDIHVTGVVRDASAHAVAGASVGLAELGLSTVTDAGGNYSIVKSLAAFPLIYHNRILPAPVYADGAILFGVSTQVSLVRIEEFTLAGRKIASIVDQGLSTGNYAAPLFSDRGAPQVFFARVRVGASQWIVPVVNASHRRGQDGVARLSSAAAAAVLAKQAMSVDTILVSAAGFARARMPISSYSGVWNFTLEKTVFGLVAPADSAMITGTRKPVLSWLPDVNAVSYDVYLNISRSDYIWTAGGRSLLDNFTQIAQGLADDSIFAPSLDDRWTYKWYVVSTDASGNKKNSPIRTFSVYNPTIDATVVDSVPIVAGCRDLDKNGTIEPYENWRLPVAVRVNDLLSRMSKTEKAMQLFFAADRYPGAGWTTYLNSADLVAVQKAAAKTKWGIPVITTSGSTSGYYTTFPSQAALAATRDLDIIYKCAAMQRDEQLVQSFRAAMSPVAETGTKVLYSRIGDGCGENADFGAAMMRAMVCAYQNGPELNPKSILAMPNHWIAGQDDIPFDAVTLQYLLKPWRASIEAGAAAIMAGLGTNTKYFTSAGGASTNAAMIAFLRDSLGFNGVLCTDFLDVGFWAGCLNAGADVLGNASPGAVDMASFAAQIPDSRIDSACARVLQVKFRLGLFESPYGNAALSNAVLDGANHLITARTAARESMTLLTNDGILPLSLSAGDTLVIAGLRANDGSSYAGLGSSFHDTTIWLTIRKTVAAAGAVAVYDSVAPVHLNAKAAICVVGEAGYSNIPAWGADSLDMPQDQLVLLQGYRRAGIPVVAIVIMPRPYALAWAADSANALVVAYRPGDGAGDAVSGLVFGAYAPRGRLPWQLPRSSSQVGTNTEANMIEQWDIPYDIGATAAERQKIRSLIAGGSQVNSMAGDSLYGAPLFQYGFGIQGWSK